MATQQQFKNGNLQGTTNALDLAVMGEGFFTVKTTGASDAIAYTRNGAFSVDSKRNVVDAQGSYLMVYPVDNDGNVYVADGFNYRVEIFDSTGKYVREFGKQGNIFGTFSRMKGIALDSYKNIYVLDAMHQNFQIFNNAGEMLMFVGKYSVKNDGFIKAGMYGEVKL